MGTVNCEVKSGRGPDYCRSTARSHLYKSCTLLYFVQSWSHRDWSIGFLHLLAVLLLIYGLYFVRWNQDEADAPLWEQDWDDEDEDADFARQLKEELKKMGK